MTVTGFTVGGVGVPLGAGVAALCVTALTVRGVGPAGTGVALDCVTRETFPDVGVPLGAGVAALWVTALTVGGVGVAGTGVAAEVVAGVSLAGVGVGVGVGMKAVRGGGPGVAAAVELVAADPIARLAARVATMMKEKNASDAMRTVCTSEGPTRESYCGVHPIAKHFSVRQRERKTLCYTEKCLPQEASSVFSNRTRGA
jgi:hypothetical protein